MVAVAGAGAVALGVAQVGDELLAGVCEVGGGPVPRKRPAATALGRAYDLKSLFQLMPFETAFRNI